MDRPPNSQPLEYLPGQVNQDTLALSHDAEPPVIRRCGQSREKRPHVLRGLFSKVLFCLSAVSVPLFAVSLLAYAQQAAQQMLLGTIASAPVPPNISFGTETQLGGIGYYGFASSGNNVYLIQGPGAGDVNFRRSTDQGSTWSGDTLIGTNAYPYLDTPLIADGNNIFAIYVKNTVEVTDWCCPRNAGEVFVTRSTDNGATWSASVRVSAVNARAYRIGANVAGANVHVVSWITGMLTGICTM